MRRGSKVEDTQRRTRPEENKERHLYRYELARTKYYALHQDRSCLRTSLLATISELNFQGIYVLSPSDSRKRKGSVATAASPKRVRSQCKEPSPGVRERVDRPNVNSIREELSAYSGVSCTKDAQFSNGETSKDRTEINRCVLFIFHDPGQC